MSDNFGISTGSDATVSADDVGGVLFQNVKLDVGAGGVSTPAIATSTTLAALPTTPRYDRARLSVTPTISTSIYAAKDAIGGMMTFTSAARASGGSGLLRSVTIVGLAQQLAAIDLVLFSATITGTVTDNAAFDPADADLANVVGYLTIPVTTGWQDYNDNAVSFTQCQIPYVCAATSLFGALVARGTPTFAATTDITVILGVERD